MIGVNTHTCEFIRGHKGLVCDVPEPRITGISCIGYRVLGLCTGASCADTNFFGKIASVGEFRVACQWSTAFKSARRARIQYGY